MSFRARLSCLVSLVCLAACAGSGMGDPHPDAADAGPHPDGGSVEDAPLPQRDADLCRSFCGTACCDDGECVAGECVARCAGTRCDDACCGGEQLCVGGGCFEPTQDCVDHEDCPGGQICEPLIGRCVPVDDEASCRYVPTPGVFEPRLEWRADIGLVSALPLVARMNDDDGDGRIGPSDTPDVIATRHTPSGSINNPVTDASIVVLSGDDGEELGRSPGNLTVMPWTSPAIADVDDDGHPEVFTLIASGTQCRFLELCETDADCSSGYVCAPPGADPEWLVCCTDGDSAAYLAPRSRLIALTYEPATGNPIGRVSWTSPTDLHLGQPTIAVADLGGDGTPEVIVGSHAYDAQTGALRWRNGSFIPYRNASPESHLQRYGDIPIVMDLDGDGRSEGYRSDAAVDADGRTLWLSDLVPRGHVAPGDLLSSHPGAELFVSNGYRAAILDPATGLALAGPFMYDDDGDEAIDGLQSGAPVVADFDGDGDVEAAIYSQNLIAIFDFDDAPATAPIRWSIPNSTDFGSTSVAVFDFDADGRVEIVMLADGFVQILGIEEGTPMLKTLWTEAVPADTVWQYPVVADIDLDDNAEIVLTTIDGIRVYGDARDNWVTTRSVLNQHAYYINNVEEDLKLPRSAPSSVSTHGTFRLQRLPDAERITIAPDLTVDGLSADTLRCPFQSSVFVRVLNRGAQGVAAGVSVSVREGPPRAGAALLGTALTTTPLLSGQAAWVEVLLEAPGFSDTVRRLTVHAVVDDAAGGGAAHNECIEDNNMSASFDVVCPELI